MFFEVIVVGNFPNVTNQRFCKTYFGCPFCKLCLTYEGCHWKITYRLCYRFKWLSCYSVVKINELVLSRIIFAFGSLWAIVRRMPSKDLNDQERYLFGQVTLYHLLYSPHLPDVKDVIGWNLSLCTALSNFWPLSIKWRHRSHHTLWSSLRLLRSRFIFELNIRIDSL